MLTGIGLIIILKQIPHFFGRDTTIAGGFMEQISYGSTVIALVSMGILLLWETVLTKKAKIFQLIQGPLVAVLVGILYSVATQGDATWGINTKQLVSVPTDIASLNFITTPNFAAITDINVWIIAFTIAFSGKPRDPTLCRATDKIDPEKRVTQRIENLSLKE